MKKIDTLKIKMKIKKLKNKIQNFIANNKLFAIYILLSLIETFLIRLLTTKAIISYKPLITDLGIIIILGSFAFFIKKDSKKYLYLQLLLCFYTLICVVNGIYYAFYSSYASITELNSLGQAHTVAGSFFERLSIGQFVYILFPVIFIFCYKKLHYKVFNFEGQKKERQKKFKKVFLTGLAFILLSFATAKGQDYSRLYKQWNRTYIVNRFGIILYQTSDLFSSLTSKLTTMFGFENALMEMDDFYNNKEDDETNKWTGIFEGYNVVFVHMESIQSFLIDLSFNNEEVLPTIHKLMNEGMYFSNFYPEISTGTSSDTEFSLLTSLLPTRVGVVFTKYYNRDYVTIPKLLNDKGYYTFSMHGNDFTMWNRHNAHPSLGYKNFYFKDKYTYTDDQAFNLGIKDEYFFEQSLKYLENIEKENANYMGTVITLSNHSPYIYLDKYAKYDLSKTYIVYNSKTRRYENKKVDYLTGTTIGNYIISSHSADLDLGKFVSGIENSDAFNNTIFVFYGDHDARLSKDQFNYYYNYNPETDELLDSSDPNYYDYNDYEHHLNKSTPLIIWSKNKNVQNIIKGEYDYPMGMIDVMPTIGNMIGIKNEYALGHDIFSIKYDNIVPFPDGDYITSDYYYSSTKDNAYVLKNNAIINDDIIQKGIEYTNKRIQISNDIIIHDLIKYRRNYKKNKLL